MVPLDKSVQLEIPVQMLHQLVRLRRVTPVQLGRPVSLVRLDQQVRMDRGVNLVPSVYKDHLDSRDLLATLALQDKLDLSVGQGQAVLLALLVRLGSEEIRDREEIQGHKVLQVNLDLLASLVHVVMPGSLDPLALSVAVVALEQQGLVVMLDQLALLDLLVLPVLLET